MASTAIGLATAFVLSAVPVPSRAAPANAICPNGASDIRPGVGVGPINIGMTMPAVMKATHVGFGVGNGFSNSRYEPMTAGEQPLPITPETVLMRVPDLLSAPTLRGVVLYTQGFAVVYITLNDFGALGGVSRARPPLPPIASCATNSGLHLGSLEQDVLAHYGTGASMGDLLGFHYVANNAAGILFGFDTLGAAAHQEPPSVTLVGVFKPGTLCKTLEVAAAATRRVPRFDCTSLTPQP